MASQWRQVQHDLQQEKLELARFVSEGGHDLTEAKKIDQRESTWMRTGHNVAPKVHFSLSLDEETLDVIKRDADFQGVSPQDLVRWLLGKYAEGELTAKHFPEI